MVADRALKEAPVVSWRAEHGIAESLLVAFLQVLGSWSPADFLHLFSCISTGTLVTPRGSSSVTDHIRCQRLSHPCDDSVSLAETRLVAVIIHVGHVQTPATRRWRRTSKDLRTWC